MNAESALARYARSLELYHRGELDAALACCAELLAIEPDHAGALQLMGVLRARDGAYEAAVELFDRAIEADPAMASVHNNRGHALLALHRHGAAVASYDRALALQLVSADALNNRGTALQALMRVDEALASFERAGTVDPGFAAAHQNHGELLLELGEREAGIAALQRARAAGGDVEQIAFTLASLGVEAPADAAPAHFVRELFDGYAQRFDRHLTDRLGYRAPQLVADALAALGLDAPVDIVDLGCGTGLCAPHLRPLARRLDGVDLSSNMLERAHRLELYDTLDCDELVAYLRARPRCYDIAIAADVLIYFGDLTEVLAAVHASLRDGGWFVFTIEAGDDATPYRLGPTRRYVHAPTHVEALARAQGYVVSRCDAEVLRTESQVDVAGRLFVLRR
jgi:predicted TPR repeat methyltransferase